MRSTAMPDFSVKSPVMATKRQLRVLLPVPVGRHRHQLAEALLAFLQRLFGALARDHVVDQALVDQLQVGGALAHQFLHLARALAGGLHEGRQQQRRQDAAGQQQGRARWSARPRRAARRPLPRSRAGRRPRSWLTWADRVAGAASGARRSRRRRAGLASSMARRRRLRLRARIHQLQRPSSAPIATVTAGGRRPAGPPGSSAPGRPRACSAAVSPATQRAARPAVGRAGRTPASPPRSWAAPRGSWARRSRPVAAARPLRGRAPAHARPCGLLASTSRPKAGLVARIGSR